MRVRCEETDAAARGLVVQRLRTQDTDPSPRHGPRTDGVAWRGAASHPQEDGRQERSGGEEESADGVQVLSEDPVGPLMF